MIAPTGAVWIAHPRVSVALTPTTVTRSATLRAGPSPSEGERLAAKAAGDVRGRSYYIDRWAQAAYNAFRSFGLVKEARVAKI